LGVRVAPLPLATITPFAALRPFVFRSGHTSVARLDALVLRTPLTVFNGIRRSMRWPGRVGAMADFECAVVAKSERDPAIRVLVSAFENDPVERWLYPDDAMYREHFPAFIAAFGGDAFHDHTVWRLGDFDAVALWFAPGREPDGTAVVSAR
jgi:hypothetical protein